MYLTAVHISTIACLVTFILFMAFVLAERYPTSDGAVKGAAAEWLEEVLDLRNREMRAKYPKVASGNILRVVFLGTSQTEGIGARTRAEGFVSRLEKALNETPQLGSRVECINCAVSGARLRDLLPVYEQDWIELNPVLTVVNLCCNDRMDDRGSYASQLTRLVQLNIEVGIKTLLVLEPTSPEVWPDGFPVTLPAMRRVAEEQNVPLADAHGCMKARQDDGFLFWDLVHPTSYGHGLLAECLLPAILDEMAAAHTP